MLTAPQSKEKVPGLSPRPEAARSAQLQLHPACETGRASLHSKPECASASGKSRSAPQLHCLPWTLGPGHSPLCAHKPAF